VSSVNSPRKYHFQERGCLFKLKAGRGKGQITKTQQRGSCDSHSRITNRAICLRPPPRFPIKTWRQRRDNPAGARFSIFLDLIWAPRAPRPRVKLQGWHLSARHQTDRGSRGTNRNDDDDSPQGYRRKLFSRRFSSRRDTKIK
jgi:hypothetical protein